MRGRCIMMGLTWGSPTQAARTAVESSAGPGVTEVQVRGHSADTRLGAWSPKAGNDGGLPKGGKLRTLLGNITRHATHHSYRYSEPISPPQASREALEQPADYLEYHANGTKSRKPCVPVYTRPPTVENTYANKTTIQVAKAVVERGPRRWRS
jgi:hypothetical protein